MSGERDGARDAIGRMKQALVKDGVPLEKAKKTAIDAALRFDRMNPKK